eukprot:CAMPEP_0184728098 /NCGR_PEP_ID=MMETSP0314-20130426/38791_1 /TAXON_ID=38298 /ORGANISM="Rhodella maculata, Strain CCMP 736" /LENGTH=401 /DNA_ID=CAMNT_0027193861 /DNA_START=1 /DNA_END=1206 /DNA_ORIENTATION=+
MMKDEVALLSKLSGSPGIITLNEVINSKKVLILVLQLCEGGELFTRIINNPSFSEADAAEATRQMLRIAKICHENGIVHRDFKPENFLYDGNELVVIDFGLACKAPAPGTMLVERCGTPNYMSPELGRGGYNETVDIWAVGVILYILLSGRPPFNGIDNQQIRDQVCSGKYDLKGPPWSSISEPCKSVIKKMLAMNPQDRPSAASLLSDPWVREGGLASSAPLKSLADLKKHMLEFVRMNQLKKATMLQLANLVEGGKLEELKNAFQEVDVDGSGSLSKNELKIVAQKLGLPFGDKDLDKLMQAYDFDGDGEISYQEFVAFSDQTAKAATVENLRSIFEKYDTDDNQKLSILELQAMIQEAGDIVSQKNMDVIMKDLDKDGSGDIDFEEFCHMFSNLKAPL